MANLTEAQKRKARQEFDRRRASYTDSTVTSGTSFDSFLATYVATEAFSGDTYSTSSCDTTSSNASDSTSYSDGGSSSCDAGSF